MSTNNPGRPPVPQPMDKLMSIPIPSGYYPSIQAAAGQEQRPVAAYVRYLIFSDLKRRGLVDDNFNIVELETEADAEQEG